MVKYLTGIIFILSGLFIKTGFSENSYNAEFYDKISPKVKALVDSVYNEEFDNAEKISDELIRNYKNHPVGYFLKAAVCDTIINDYGDYRYYEIFDKNINESINLASSLIKDTKNNGNEKDRWMYFYLGGALGYRGLHRFIRNDWLPAFNDGLNAVKQLEVCLKIDPQLYDAYYGLGCFHYWKSAKSKLLWFLPFINDEREKGIEQLLVAVKKGLYTKNEARYAILRIYNNERMYEQAILLADKIGKEKPNDVFNLAQKGYSLREMEKWDEAADNYTKLIDLYKKSKLHCFERMAEAAFLKLDSLSRTKNINKEEIEKTYLMINEEKKTRKSQGQNITKEAKKHLQGIEHIYEDSKR